MNTVKGLSDFCKKHRIPIPVGDKFSLLDFLLEVSKKSVHLAEYRGRVTEVIHRMGNESSEWGGCPSCGSNVHLGLKECPVCGKNLNFEEPEVDERDALSSLDPSYSAPKKPKPVSSLDEFDEEEDDENSSDDPLEEEDEMEEDSETDEEMDEIEEDEEELEDEENSDEEETEESDDEENLEDSPQDSSEEDDIEESDESEPLSGPRKAVSQGEHFLSKRHINRPVTEHAEKCAERETRRKKLESLLPKFRKDPSLVMRLQYRDLLIMPGLLGYMRKPTSIGSKDDMRAWVKNALKGGFKK